MKISLACMRIVELAEVYQHSKKMEGASSPISCSAA